MFKARTLSLGLLVVLAVGASCAEAAFAAEVQPKYTKNGNAIKTQTKVKGKIGEFFIEVPKGVSFTFVCKGVDNSATVTGEGQSKLKLEFTACEVISNPECGVQEPIELKLSDQLVYKEGNKANEVQDIFYSGKFTEGTWGSVTLLFCGVLDGKYAIRGSAIGVLKPNKSGEKAAQMKIAFNGNTSPTGTYLNHMTNTTEKAGAMNVNGFEAFLRGKIEEELETGEEIGVS